MGVTVNRPELVDCPDVGGLRFKFAERDLHAVPVSAAFLLREHHLGVEDAHVGSVPVASFLGGRFGAGANDEDTRVKLDGFGGALPKVFVAGFEAEPRHSASPVGRSTSDVRDFEPCARRGDQLLLRRVGLPAGFGDGVLGRDDGLQSGLVGAPSEPGREAGSPGGEDARRPGDAPVYALSALVAFIAGSVMLARTWARSGPVWLAMCGWFVAVVGWAGALIAGIPWLWRAMA